MDRLVAYATAWAQFICVVGACRSLCRHLNNVYHAFFMKTTTGLLNKKIEALPFSDELKSILYEHECATLQHLLNEPVKVWMAYDGFNYHHLKEITGFAIINNLNEYIKY